MHKHYGTKKHLKKRWGQAFIVLGSHFTCHFTEQDLRNLHRRFGHPNVQKLSNVLICTTGKKIAPQTFHILRQIQKHCKYFQRYGGKHQHLKFNLRDDTLAFNHSIYCDILTIDKRPVIHVGDEATRFQATQRLANMTDEELWFAQIRRWINVY